MKVYPVRLDDKCRRLLKEAAAKYEIPEARIVRLLIKTYLGNGHCADCDGCLMERFEDHCQVVAEV